MWVFDLDRAGALDAGSTFTVYLPHAVDDAAPIPPSGMFLPVCTGTETILLSKTTTTSDQKPYTPDSFAPRGA
jgi:hypothetical protein